MRLALMPLFVAISFMFAGATAAMDKENTLYIDLKDGRVVIEMRPDLAPNHVKQIKKLAREGKYDGVLFHRVIEGFMAQTGDPTGTGSGGMGETLKSEFSKEPHVRGSVSMARTNDPNSARSQFFIVFKDSTSSTASTRCGARSPRAWSSSTRSSAARRVRARAAAPADKMIKVQVAADAKN